jgi:proline iminopeptidase
MDKIPDQKRAVQYLHPPIDPFDQRMMDVGDGHSIYVEQCGNPDGIPVVVLHGGPGGGCSPSMRRYFDPEKYHVILFDQRGCGRSKPFASVINNTTWDLVSDIEHIREALGIEKWIAFGGSWGATLALIYAEAHPDRVRNIILRGVFMMTQAELDWFYGGGAGKFWPDLWARFTGLIPEAEHGDLIAAYHRRLFCGDRMTEVKYGKAFARLENHYFTNAGFLEFDGQILAHVDRIAHIPGVIVQGRYDMICPPSSAYELAQAWPNAELKMVRNAGHALSEPGISAELVRTMDRIAAQ